MIFGGSVAYDSKRRRKLARREVYMAKSATPAFLQWSEATITFDRIDHLESIPQLERYPLVVDPIIGMKWLTKVLMDGGNDLNIMYVETLYDMGIERSRIQPPRAPFHGSVPRKCNTSGVTSSFSTKI